MRHTLFLIAVLTALPAHAFPARVYSVHDGDTVTLLTDAGKVHCRLAGIDSPEIHVAKRWPDQPGAYEAHAALDNLVMGQVVDVQDTGQRSYKRMVCRMTVAGQDVQRAMIAEGWAWSAVQYEPAAERDPAIPALEQQARAAHRGIWAAPAVAPWDWRHGLK